MDSCKLGMGSDQTMSKFYMQLRYARPSSDLGGSDVDTRFLDGFLAICEQVGYNQSLEVTDACTAQICQRLRPRVQPVAAKPDIGRMCTLLNRLQDGVIDTCDFLAEATTAWEDTYCCPCGFVLFETDEQTHEIRARRTDPLGWFWMRDEGRNPIHLCYEEWVSKVVLCEQYPEFEEQIMRSTGEGPRSIAGVDPPASTTDGLARVVHVWRRKVGAKQGKKIVSVNRTVLNGENSGNKKENSDRQGAPWPYDFFPVAVFRNRWDNKGFGGIPMLRYIAPHHIAINKLARTADESFKGAIPLIMSHKNSKINELSDVPYQIAKWDGQHRPEVIAVNPVSEQLLRRIDYHDAKSYALAGINKSVAAGQAPKGVVAAVAMREIIQLAAARASEYQKRWESGWDQAGHIIVALANELKRVHIKGKGQANEELMTEIDTSAIKLDRNDYRIRYGVTSALSKSIPGLLEDLTAFKDLGFITPVQMALAIGDKVPDLQAEIDAQTAPYRLAQKMVQDALDNGKIPVPPSKMQGQEGLDAIVVMGQKAWCAAQINPDRYSTENLEALRRLMRAAVAKKGAPQVALPRVQPAEPMAPDALVGVGTPALPGSGGIIARNKYEAASIGLQLPQLPPQQP